MSQKKKGVLLVNLGTPDAPTTVAVKRYLKQFLGDPRVVDVSRLLWLPILHGIVLPFRSPRVAKLYHEVWMQDGSPLLVYSRRQQVKLAHKLPDIPVELGMSYGSPSLESAIDSLIKQGVEELIVLPLYPQYSCSTTGAVFDGIATLFKQRRTFPGIRFIRDYATHPLYIEALFNSIKESFEKQGKPDCLLLSFHGIPVRYANTGDDYPNQCNATTQQLKAKLELELDFAQDKVLITYQSRFGREPWLTPYTDKTMESLPEKGIKHVQVICPGFASDCLETLEEIQQQNCQFFMDNGGEQFHYIPALNDNDSHIALFQSLVDEYR